MFDSHPEFCGPAPSHMTRTFAYNRFKYGNIQQDDNWDILTNDVADLLNNQLGKWKTQWSAAKIRKDVETRSLSAIIQHVYKTEAYAHDKNGIFIKENQTFRFAPFLLASFPDVKFVYLVRDPRDMASSWKVSPSHPGRVHRGAQVWKNDQKGSLELYGFLQDAEKIILVRYKDLVSKPEIELRRICNFLLIPYNPSMLEFYKNDLTIKNSERIRGWHNLQRPIISNNFAKYRTMLGELEIRYIEALCQPEMEFLGYPLDFASTDDLSLLEQALLESEKRLPGKHETLSKEEETIRSRRLAVIERIIHRKL
jgi:hypothetical protein